jgi:hypothetical protein
MTSEVANEVAILENLNIRDAWQGMSVHIYGLMMLIMVSLFWAMLLFDMIDDNYGIDSAISVSACYAVTIPIVVVYLTTYLARSHGHRSDDHRAANIIRS